MTDCILTSSANYCNHIACVVVYTGCSTLQLKCAIICRICKRPTLILAMGNEAYAYCKELLGDQTKLKYLPHFSGAATWKAKAYFGIPKEQKMSVEELADTYVKAIIEGHCEDQ